jgi:uncharacterized membrane protein YkvA (DUF1232 family)
MSKKLSFKNALKRASRILTDKKRGLSLVKDAQQVLTNKAKRSEKLQAVKNQLFTFIRLVKAYFKGQYREVSVKSMLYTIAVLIYFVTPTDIVPDFIPFGGYLDDASLIIWLYQYLGVEMQQFLDWESKLNQIESHKL